jgi:hypothetical protein
MSNLGTKNQGSEQQKARLSAGLFCACMATFICAYAEESPIRAVRLLQQARVIFPLLVPIEIRMNL